MSAFYSDFMSHYDEDVSAAYSRYIFWEMFATGMGEVRTQGQLQFSTGLHLNYCEIFKDDIGIYKF